MAIHAELAAFDSGEAGRIEAATGAKLAALAAVDAEVAAGYPPARASVEEARRLNDVAAARAARLVAEIDRQMAQLAAAAGRAVPLCYGADGRRA